MKKEKSFLYNFKVKPGLYQTIKDRARKYTAGNVSAWIKLASVNYEPKIDQVESRVHLKQSKE